ncbi:MAG: 30S ribosomal protein S20 [Microgenomates group bacterium Gr01-1014_16]|nr:MAG: 30S ribosomal protein S20 [Microgenomates group bacterium Gr01-1014_16]
MRADKKRAKVNLAIKTAFKKAVSGVRKKPTKKNLEKVFSKLDLATKKGVIKKNKAARLKSRLASRIK